MSKFTDFIKDRYMGGGSDLDLGNIAKDVGVAGALYGIINPNDSSGLASFFGTGGRQQPVGYTGGIPNYTATRELVPNAFAQTYTTPTGEVAPRRPGGVGRRYFTDTTFTQDTGTPFMGITAEQIAAQNQAALDEQAFFESLLSSAATQRETATTTPTGGITTPTGGITTPTGGTTIPTGGTTTTSTDDTTGTTATGGTVYDESGVYTAGGYKAIPYNNFVNQFMGRDLTADDATAIAASGYPLVDLAASFGVDPDALLSFVNYYVNSGGTGSTGGLENLTDRQLTAAELKQAVLDGTMDYSTAYRELGIADAVNPFGFTEDEQMALGIHESQRTGQGYKYNPTTGSMDLYDYDTDAFVDTTGTGETLTLNAADGTTSTVDLGAGADTTSFTGTANADSIYGPAVFDLSTIDPAGGFSEQDQNIIANEIVSGRLGIADVAEEFEGVSQLDVMEGLLRGGYQTPEQITTTLNAVDPNTEFTEELLVANLLETNKTTPEEVAAYYGLPVSAVTARYRELGGTKFARGGMAQGQGYYLGGPTDGMADQIPATINNMEPARLSDGEFVIPADVVSHLGNGNSDAGAKNLYSMMERVRKDRTGNPKQGKQIDPNKYLA